MLKLNQKQKTHLLLNFEKWTDIPMLLLIFVMMATLLLPIITTLSKSTLVALEIIDVFILLLFAIELSIRTYLANNRLIFLKKNWLNALIVLLPIFSIFRFFQTIRLLRILRLTRLLVLFVKSSYNLKTMLFRHHFHYLLVILFSLIGLGSILIYRFDQELIGSKEGFADSLWLAIVNAFSGGYANIYPMGPEARVISIFLILFGTVLVSYFTASLASYFTEKEQDIEQERIEKKLNILIEDIQKIKKKI